MHKAMEILEMNIRFIKSVIRDKKTLIGIMPDSGQVRHERDAYLYLISVLEADLQRQEIALEMLRKE